MAEIPHVQNPVTDYAKSKGWKARRMQYIGRVGCPDSWFFKDGLVLIIEFKDLGEIPTPQQKREIKRLRAAGMNVYVVDNKEAGFALIDMHTVS